MIPAAVALGSNLGDRERYLRDAAGALGEIFESLRLSTFHETDAVGVGDQPRFLNAAATGYSTLSARDLLTTLLQIEKRLGRERPFQGAPRTIDLDLILYGDSIIDEPGLRMPHPRFRERLFVLEPLAEIAAGWTDPVTGRTVGQLLESASAP